MKRIGYIILTTLMFMSFINTVEASTTLTLTSSTFYSQADYAEDKVLLTSVFSSDLYAGAGRNGDESDETSDVVENFCSGSRLGVFTTIGWVFFIVKIVVPILLIVLGSIDLARIVIAGKEDEIRKSTTKLIKRAIAGIIIFFVPTVINFVVDVINGDDVYNGSTFATCTKCMLKPSDTVCTGLGGE